MFAILLSDAMDPFYKNVTSFPTLIFTILLLLCLFFFLFSVLGVLDFDFLGLDAPEINTGDAVGEISVLAGLLIKLKLHGVPFPFSLTLFSIFGWFFSYNGVLFIFDYVPDGWLEYLVGIPILIGSTVLSAFMTALTIKPFKSFFEQADQEVEKNIVGQVAVVRTSRVDKSFGEATVDDGGAGLIVKVRAYHDEIFTNSDRVVLLEYCVDQNTYRVISEEEFNQGHKA